MGAEAWVGAIAVGVSVFFGVIGWATYLARTLTAISETLKGLRADLTRQELSNETDHSRIWNNIDKLQAISNTHETRLSKLESGNQIHREFS